MYVCVCICMHVYMHVCMHAFHIHTQISIHWIINISRQAVVSREAKKKQQARAYSGQCDHYSELYTRMVGLNV